jgi:molybdenum cofactor cytidylyltransferase
MKYAVLLLAAGQSRRMGRPKLLLPWRETTVLGHLLSCWSNLGAHQIAVVCGLHHADIAKELDRLGVGRESRITNPAPERGMFSSIQCAVAWPGWSHDITHWVIVLGDQPLVRVQTLKRLLHFASAHPGAICQPVLDGRRKHPVILPKPVWLELSRTDAPDLRTFLQSHPQALRGLESDDPGLAIDLDFPEDYQRALRLLEVEFVKDCRDAGPGRPDKQV